MNEIVKKIFYSLFILFALIAGNYFITYNMFLRPIYKYYFKFKDNKAIIIKHQEEWDDDFRNKTVTHYYYIKYNVKDNFLPQYKWVVINKPLKEGQIIKFKYNPDNPKEMKFSISTEFLLLFMVSIPLNIAGIFFLKFYLEDIYLSLKRKKKE